MKNPITGYAESYRLMQRDGAESVSIWSIIADLERNMAPAVEAQLAALREDLARKDVVVEDMLQSNSDMTTCLAAAEQRNAGLVELLKRIDRTPLDCWYRDALNVAVAAAIKPTESGASE